MFGSATIESKLLQAASRPSGFDYMRLILCSLVIASHCISVTQGEQAVMGLVLSHWRLLIVPILPMFFALSGFLVAGSLYRCRTLISFAGLRVIRLIPALMTEVVLSAIIIGPIFTALSLHDYITNDEFWPYFLNILGRVHTTLPGVFSGSPLPGVVNSQLWTIPAEMESYVSLALFAVLGLVWKRNLFALALLFIQILIVVYVIVQQPGLEPLISGRILVFCFLCGVSAYQFRERIPHHPALLIAAILTALLLTLTPGGDYFISLPLVYVTIYLGTLNLPRNKFLLSGDYSYGMYLYGFPLQQVLVALWPWPMTWYENIAASVPLAFGVAHFSWHFIEKPALRLKSSLLRMEAYLAEFIPIPLLRLLQTRTAEAATKIQTVVPQTDLSKEKDHFPERSPTPLSSKPS
jgi:peptidoglycan/LPS O-acetylase OafA/YrhL